MKAKNLFSLLTRKELTNIATEIANCKVHGMKVKANQFIEAIAQMNGKGSEALLSDMNNESLFSFNDLHAIFDHSSGETALAAIGFSMSVNGFWDRSKIRVCEGTFEENSIFMRDVRVEFTGSSNGVDNDIDLSTNERNRNLRMAINAAFELAETINSNKRQIKSEKDLQKLIQGEWEIRHIQKEKATVL